jgi:hypothetical protein
MGALTRNIHPDTLAALSAPVIYPIIPVFLDWPDAPVYAHSNVGPLTWDLQTWTGVGEFGGLQMPDEESGMLSKAAELRLIGVPDELDAYLDDPIRNRPGEIFFGVVTERAGNVLIGEPFSIFTGYMDAMRDVVEVEDGRKRRDVAVTLARGPSQRAFAEVFHTYEDQIRQFPGDTAGRLTINAEAEGTKLTWPE